LMVSGDEKLYERLRDAIQEVVEVELGGGLEISSLLFIILCKFLLEAKTLVVEKKFKPFEAVLNVLDYYLEENLEEILNTLEKISEDLESGRLSEYKKNPYRDEKLNFRRSE